MKSKKLYLLRFETPHFSFMEIREDSKLENLTTAWKTHCKQTGADVDYFSKDDISITEMKFGMVYRDNSPILTS